MKIHLCILMIFLISAADAAAVEQCRFIPARAEREACYKRQEDELAARRKPEPARDTGTLESFSRCARTTGLSTGACAASAAAAEAACPRCCA